MPKIQFNKDGTGSITYDQDDWLAGMDTTSAGTQYGKMGGNPQMSEIDPLRSFGYVSPGFNGVAATNSGTISRILRSSVVNSTAAFILSGGSLNSGSGTGNAQIQKLTISTNTLTSDASFPHTITGSLGAVSGDDTTNYYTGTTLKEFYTWYESGNWNVGTLTYPSTFDDDFMSTVPATPLGQPYITGGGGYPHPIIKGDDDILYIGDRNFVHAYDRATGANGTFTAAVLTLPQGWIITCFTKTQDLRLAIGAYFATSAASDTYNRGEARVWIWTYSNSDVDYSIDLKDNYISELVPWSNTIGAFTYGRKTLSDIGCNKLQILNGTQFEVVKTWGSTSNILPIRGGVDNVGNDLYWNSAGQVMCYTKRPDNGKYILNNLVTVGSTGGMLKFFSGSSIYHASFGITTDGLQQFSGDYNDAGLLNAQVATPEWPALMKGELSRISIKFKNTFSGGRTLRLNTKIDDGSVVLIDDFQASTTDRLVQIQTRTDGSPFGEFSSLQPQLIWADNGSGSNREQNCPVVEYVKYEFELTNVESDLP